jgi:hypothetical protein
MNEFLLLTRRARGEDWKELYKGIQQIETLIDEICATHGISPVIEKQETGWWAMSETRKRTTSVPESAALKGLSFTFTYDVPFTNDSGHVLCLEAHSPISGKTEIKSDSPALIITGICTLVSTHDDESGKWISLSDTVG